jgi:L-ascorbate metabolism protein UlaG (beta-lactamase superfamily)
MRLTLIGHMTVWIELDGIGLLTDPWFGPHGWLERRLAPRAVPPGLTPGELETFVSRRWATGDPQHCALLLSHSHMDHLDSVSLELARRQGWVAVGSQKAVRRAEKAGVERVIALRRGEQAALDGLTIHAVEAEHPLASDAVGFVVIGSQSCYFSGDTRLTPGLAADLQPFNLDVALLQAACAHYPGLGDDGMSLGEAASLARAARPRWTVPLHLHCAGKWLDRETGQRIEMDNTARVDAAVRRWRDSLEADGLGVKLLRPGETWDAGAES